MLVSGILQSDSIIYIMFYFKILFPYRLLQNTEYSSLCYMVGPGWLSVLYTVVHALFFLFSEYYLKLTNTKDLHDSDNHNGVITDLDPDVLECEVNWALDSITMNNITSGCDGIPVELFQILKDDAVKVLHSICQQIWKTQQRPQDWKRSVFIPIPKKGNAKECSTYCTICTHLTC